MDRYDDTYDDAAYLDYLERLCIEEMQLREPTDEDPAYEAWAERMYEEEQLREQGNAVPKAKLQMWLRLHPKWVEAFDRAATDEPYLEDHDGSTKPMPDDWYRTPNVAAQRAARVAGQDKASVEVKAETTAEPEEESKTQPENQLAMDLEILRCFTEGKPMRAVDVARVLGADRDEVQGRFANLRHMGLLRLGKAVPYRDTITKKGKQLVKDSEGVDLKSAELIELADGIQGHLAVIGETKTATRIAVEVVLLGSYASRHAAGVKLRRAKKLVPCGLWKTWLRYNFGWRSQRTAQKLMKYAKAPFSAHLRTERDRWRKIDGNKPKPKQAVVAGQSASDGDDTVGEVETPADGDGNGDVPGGEGEVTDGDDTTTEDVEAEPQAEPKDETQEDDGKSEPRPAHPPGPNPTPLDDGRRMIMVPATKEEFDQYEDWMTSLATRRRLRATGVDRYHISDASVLLDILHRAYLEECCNDEEE
jgi:hypothetical protein